MTPSASPLEVVCPICGAQYGQRCRTRRGKRRGAHDPRVALAQRLARSLYRSAAIAAVMGPRPRAQAPVTVKRADGSSETRTNLPTKTRAKKHGQANLTVRRDISQRSKRVAAQNTQAALKAQFLARQKARENEDRPRPAADPRD